MSEQLVDLYHCLRSVRLNLFINKAFPSSSRSADRRKVSRFNFKTFPFRVRDDTFAKKTTHFLRARSCFFSRRRLSFVEEIYILLILFRRCLVIVVIETRLGSTALLTLHTQIRMYLVGFFSKKKKLVTIGRHEENINFIKKNIQHQIYITTITISLFKIAFFLQIFIQSHAFQGQVR